VVEVDPRIGTEFAGYRIETPLGRGGMAVVYRARDERLDRRVALKLLSPELSAGERFRERFLRESKLAASLDHPSIVPVYEAGEAEGLLFVAMGHVEGTDLASLLAREGRLEPERALAIVTALAEALDAARWGRGLVHGGLKPSEVLVARPRTLAQASVWFFPALARGTSSHRERRWPRLPSSSAASAASRPSRSRGSPSVPAPTSTRSAASSLSA
jgi:serine/threonine protein kinase